MRLKRLNSKGNINKKGTRKIIAELYEWYNKDNPLLHYVDESNNGLFSQYIADAMKFIADNEYPLTAEQNKIIADLQKKSGKDSIEDILKWYTKENLKYAYDIKAKNMLKDFVSETRFSVEELKAIKTVLGYFNHLMENYAKIYHNGQRVDIIK